MKPPIKNMNLAMAPKGDITQWFGENPALYMKAMGLKGHNGIDLVRPHGEALYAIEDGTVVSVKNDPNGFGKHLRIIGDTKNENGFYHEWTYGHNSVNLVQVGQKVTAGMHIANMGNTGFVISGATPYWKVNPFAGTHLHLGLREVRRTRRGWSYEGSDIKIEVQNYGNGYRGAIDARPILEKIAKTQTVVPDARIPLMLRVIELQKQLLALLGK